MSPGKKTNSPTNAPEHCCRPMGDGIPWRAGNGFANRHVEAVSPKVLASHNRQKPNCKHATTRLLNSCPVGLRQPEDCLDEKMPHAVSTTAAEDPKRSGSCLSRTTVSLRAMRCRSNQGPTCTPGWVLVSVMTPRQLVLGTRQQVWARQSGAARVRCPLRLKWSAHDGQSKASSRVRCCVLEMLRPLKRAASHMMS